MNKITKLLIGGLLLLTAVTAMLSAPPKLYADCDNGGSIKGALECGTSNTSGIPTSADPQDNVNNTVTQGLRILSVAVGIIAVVMVVLSGYRYITSGGDSNKIASAKGTLTYALIGLVIVVLSQLIIKFVLGKAAGVK